MQAASYQELVQTVPDDYRQRFAKALSDSASRGIIMSTIETAKPVEEIASENRIPLSTCYRRIEELENQGILVCERIVVTSSGKRFARYRATIRSAQITFDGMGLSINLIPNEEAMARMRANLVSTKVVSSSPPERISARPW
jgi:DNA-binding Lrp family transcriptional regulator